MSCGYEKNIVPLQPIYQLMVIARIHFNINTLWQKKDL